MKKRMTEILEPELMTERLQIVVSPAFLRRLDDWRAKQPTLPNKSEAVRMLVDMALKTSK